MLDHIAYAAPDLEAAVAGLEMRLGVRAAAGGKHRGLGTHNALLSLGEGVYFEIIAPDPDQPAPSQPRPFGLDDGGPPRLAAWCAKAPDIDERVARARAAGYDPGGVLALGRDRPDGTSVTWRFTFPTGAGDGLVPFLIDWGDSPHPSLDAPRGCTLVSLRGEHPRPQAVVPLLKALEVELDVAPGPAPALVLLLDTPNGQVELR
ncbi:MAG: VOC family protein [Dehalococcoidia bacterium]